MPDLLLLSLLIHSEAGFRQTWQGETTSLWGARHVEDTLWLSSLECQLMSGRKAIFRCSQRASSVTKYLYYLSSACVSVVAYIMHD